MKLTNKTNTGSQSNSDHSSYNEFDINFNNFYEDGQMNKRS